MEFDGAGEQRSKGAQDRLCKVAASWLPIADLIKQTILANYLSCGIPEGILH